MAKAHKALFFLLSHSQRYRTITILVVIYKAPFLSSI